MAADFRIIVFTSPAHIESESDKIVRLLDHGVDIIHLRKPEGGYEDLRRLIAEIPASYHHRLRLHDHFSLAKEFDIGGFHLNSRNPNLPDYAGPVTKSCHSIGELRHTAMFEYVTLSPIFDSISKTGYRSRFDLDRLSDDLAGKHVVALGGVTPESFLVLRRKGFYGAALLGYIWDRDFETSLRFLADGIHSLQAQQ